MAKENPGAPRALIGPNGLVEVKQMNGVQGWHSGYLTPYQARALAAELIKLADIIDSQNLSRAASRLDGVDR